MMILRPVAPTCRDVYRTIDSHTMGESTRIVYDGFPDLPGETMMEKKRYLEKHYDYCRTALMLEPRGHRDMFGALLTKPVRREANFGVIFMNSGGYLNMCGHGCIGAAAMAVETGLVPATEPFTELVLDTPAGAIPARVHVTGGKARAVSLTNAPSFLYEENLRLSLPGYGTISYDIAFGGSFFALVDAEKAGLALCAENIRELTALGMQMRAAINRERIIRHPVMDIAGIDLVEFCVHSDSRRTSIKNCVIFGDAQVDRSPCGTGSSAELAKLYANGHIGPDEPLVCESITGSRFVVKAIREAQVGGYKAIIPEITGSAYITGMCDWILVSVK
jgi:proline racemase